MASGAGTLGSSRLRRLARRAAEEAEATREQCDLCGEPIPAEHRHLLDASTRELKCVCRPCAILFDRREAGGGHYRLVPDRRLWIEDFELDDGAWDALRIPVDMAFFFPSSAEGRVVAFYPGPMGATESLLELRAWREIENANPVLRGLEPDVEALLVNRARGAREHWIVPIDDCYALVGVIRTRWRGLTGGADVWGAIAEFFRELDRRACARRRPARRARETRGPAGRSGRGRRGAVMSDSDSGKAHTGIDKPTHVPGTNKGGSIGSYESQTGHNPDGTSTAERSTGVDPKSSGPIDPRMPNLSPA